MHPNVKSEHALGHAFFALPGALVWLGLLLTWKASLHSDEWARLLLLLAVLCWAPLALSMLVPRKEQPAYLGVMFFVAALGFASAFCLPRGYGAAALVLPWLALSLWLLSRGLSAFLMPHNLAAWVEAAAQVFLPIGALWALADRLGLRPLDFDPAIVLLTAVHFHYAGFIFPLLLAWALERNAGSTVLRLAGALAVLAIPLTAVGITVSKASGNLSLESFSGVLVAIAAWLGAFAYFKMGINSPRRGQGVLWVGLAFSMAAGMSLAFLYAIRPVWALDWLDIPAMRALHGSTNALGIAGFGLGAWYIEKNVVNVKV